MFKRGFTSLLFTVALFCNLVAADPTRPTYTVQNNGSAQVNTAMPVLEALFVASSGRKAIINGKVYLEGQEKSGVRVLSIDSDTVSIEYMRNGELQAATLTLKQADKLKQLTSEQKSQ